MSPVSAGGRRTWVLVGALLLMVAGMLPATLTGALAVQLQSGLGMTRTWVGVLVSVFFTAGAIASTRAGVRADRAGWRRASVVGGAASVLSLVAFATFVRSPLAAAAVLAIGGVAMTASVATSNLVLAVEMPAHRLGLLLGLKQSAVPLAGLTSGIAVPVVALRVGWTWTFALAALVPLAAIVLALTTPGSDTGTPRRVVPATPQERFVPSRRLRTLAVGMGFAAVIPGVLTGFLVITAVDAGLSEGAAGLLLAMCSLLGITVRVGYGWTIDRLDSDGIGHVAGLLAGGAVGASLIATGGAPLVVGGALLAFSCGWGWPGLFFYELVRDHPVNPAGATGVSQRGALIGSAIGPLAFGWVADNVSTAWAWVGTAGLAAIASVVMAMASRMPRPAAGEPKPTDLPSGTPGVLS